jgi:hypothetical protein
MDMNDSTNSKLPDLAKLIPLTFIVSLLSHLSIIFYYQKFHFISFPYLDSYEILVASMRDFVITCVITILVIQFSVLGSYNIVLRLRYNYAIRTRRNAHKNMQDGVPIYSVAKNYRFPFGTFVIIYWTFPLLIPKSVFDIKDVYHGILLAVYLASALYLSIMWSYDSHIQIVKSKKGNWREVKAYSPLINPNLLFAGYIIIIFLYLFATLRADYTLKKNPYKGSFIILDSNEKIRVTSKVILIGKSRNFYFLYNTPDSSVRVVNRSQITKELVKLTD